MNAIYSKWQTLNYAIIEKSEHGTCINALAFFIGDIPALENA